MTLCLREVTQKQNKNNNLNKMTRTKNEAHPVKNNLKVWF